MAKTKRKKRTKKSKSFHISNHKFPTTVFILAVVVIGSLLLGYNWLKRYSVPQSKPLTESVTPKITQSDTNEKKELTGEEKTIAINDSFQKQGKVYKLVVEKLRQGKEFLLQIWSLIEPSNSLPAGFPEIEAGASLTSGELGFILYGDNSWIGSWEKDSGTYNSYLLTVDAGDVKALTGWSSKDYKIVSISEATYIKPYLLNPEYCQVDNDCSGKMNWCTIGAYNQYYKMGDYGCESGFGAQGYTREKIKEIIKNCPKAEDSDIVPYTPVFTQAKCINKTCKAVDMKIVCGYRPLPQ